MQLAPQPSEFIRVAAPNEDTPYLPVSFDMAAALYITPFWQKMSDCQTDEKVRQLIADSVLDAARDGCAIALILTPATDKSDPTGVPTWLRAVWWDRQHKQMRALECPAQVYGDLRSEAGVVTGFMTTPASRQALADWIVSIGGRVEPFAPLN